MTSGQTQAPEARSELPITAADREAILATLGRYVQLVDNGAWEHAEEVFTADANFGGGRVSDMAGSMDKQPVPIFPHQCTDAVMIQTEPGVVRAWSKFFTVRGDGTLTSGDYMDTIVRLPGGDWRIAERAASMGNRPPSDPRGEQHRSFNSALWRGGR